MLLSKIKNISKGIVLDNELMSKHTSYGIGGKVLAYIRPFDKYELIKIIKLLNENNSKIYFVGSGSNLLVNDKKINAYIITPAKALKLFNIDDNIITAESGVMLGKVVKESIKHNLTGLEGLVGVPGTLGGALMMNAGAWGAEISNYLISVDIVSNNGEIKKLYPDDIEFKYRYSSFSSNEFILSAKFKLNKANRADINKRKQIASKGRIRSQPLKFRSAGSVFKNPHKKLAAGLLIDKVGLKGTRYGHAEISDHHANFMENINNASSQDALYLINFVQQKINNTFNISLQPEVSIFQ